jgi:DNA-binding transcriptional regulator YhcF (GntR family)
VLSQYWHFRNTVRYHARMQGELDLSVDRATRTPLGAQLAGRIRTAVEDGTLVPGDRLPSVRELADIAGVNVNTVRAVYARLESEGRVSSEQGRGTFVAARAPTTGGATTRQELHRQIAALEAALVRLPPPPLGPDDSRGVAPPGRAALLSTEDLEAVRDGLVVRLHELDAQRAEVLQRLGELGAEEETIEAISPRRATPSLAGARIRWVGA